MPQLFSYQPDNGVIYARRFALFDSVLPGQRLFYYSRGDDCTNFISQCVWAAYGGWLPGTTPAATAENASRILQNLRQVDGLWFGSKYHVGSTRWCRVEEFYSFAVSRKPYGPAAQKIAEGLFSQIDPRLLIPGDVVQLVVIPYAPARYGHGLYVTQSGSSWQEVRICCHTDDRLDTPMSEFALQPEVFPRLRVLRFGPAGFVR